MDEVIIQVHVPICPECGGMMKWRISVEKYQCYHCGNRYSIVEEGKNDRSMICKKEKN